MWVLQVKLITKKCEDTFYIGKIIGEELVPGSIICLQGDLGVGKTVLAQGIGCGLGVKDYISSPTFNLMNYYEGRFPMYHFDLYRLEDVKELEELGWEEFLFGEGMAVVEWPEKLYGLLGNDYLRISLQRISGNSDDRCIHIEGVGEGGRKLLELINKRMEFYEDIRNR